MSLNQDKELESEESEAGRAKGGHLISLINR